MKALQQTLAAEQAVLADRDRQLAGKDGTVDVLVDKWMTELRRLQGQLFTAQSGQARAEFQLGQDLVALQDSSTRQDSVDNQLLDLNQSLTNLDFDLQNVAVDADGRAVFGAKFTSPYAQVESWNALIAAIKSYEPEAEAARKTTLAPVSYTHLLRAFSFGHVRQLDAVIAEPLRRAWALGTGPGATRLVVDVDSTICQVYGRAKSGAAYGYTKVLGYHPIVAVRAGSGEILHARMRKGSANTARGTKRFVEELVARARRAGASGEIVMRFDSGFWSNATIAVLGRLDVRFTMAVRCGNSAIALSLIHI